MKLIVKLFIISILIEFNYSQLLNSLSKVDIELANNQFGNPSLGFGVLTQDYECGADSKGVRKVCKDGKECYIGKCYLQRYPGELCNQNGECKGRNCDVSQRKCRNVCYKLSDCQDQITGFCDKGGQVASSRSGSCQLKRDVGGKCYSDDNCITGNCAAGKCLSGQKLSDGSLCKFHDECLSHRCLITYEPSKYEKTVCKQLKGVGEECIGKWECASGNCQNNPNNGNRQECVSIYDNTVAIRKDDAYADPLGLAKGGNLNIGSKQIKEFNTFLTGTVG